MQKLDNTILNIVRSGFDRLFGVKAGTIVELKALHVRKSRAGNNYVVVEAYIDGDLVFLPWEDVARQIQFDNKTFKAGINLPKEGYAPTYLKSFLLKNDMFVPTTIKVVGFVGPARFGTSDKKSPAVALSNYEGYDAFVKETGLKKFADFENYIGKAPKLKAGVKKNDPTKLVGVNLFEII